MTAVEPSHPATSSTPDPSHPALPRLVTSTKRAGVQRPLSLAKNRGSTPSNLSHSQSRPTSHVLPAFEPVPSFPAVRDFAYSALHPLHYGPAPEASEPASIASTPVSEFQRRLSDPTRASWGTSLGGWSAGPWGGDGSVNDQHLPPYLLKDGSPYPDDDDLQSPVFTSRHKRHKTTVGAFGGGHGRGRGRGGDEPEGMQEGAPCSPYYDKERGYYTGTRDDGSETYYVNEGAATANGPGGEYVTYPPEQARHRTAWAPHSRRSQRDSHFAITLPNRSYVDEQQHQAGTGAMSTEQSYSSDDPSDPVSSPGIEDDGEPGGGHHSHGHRFRIRSPDEPMHGKAVALFDFERENENELPLVEGQVISVSYRHGQGWLVAEDPRTHESGLVPEEYVRLLEDIEGGWNSNDDTGGLATDGFDINTTPTRTDQTTPVAGSPRLLANGGSSGGGGDGVGASRGSNHWPLHETHNGGDHQRRAQPRPSQQQRQQRHRHPEDAAQLASKDTNLPIQAPDTAGEKQPHRNNATPVQDPANTPTINAAGRTNPPRRANMSHGKDDALRRSSLASTRSTRSKKSTGQ